MFKSRKSAESSTFRSQKILLTQFRRKYDLFKLHLDNTRSSATLIQRMYQQFKKYNGIM